MEHASMVHALGEIHRTLKPGGILIDLRPVEEHWAVEVSSSAGMWVAGRLTDLPNGLEDTAACSAAMQDAKSRGWFVREREEEFTFFYYWDTPSDMKAYVDIEWEDYEKMEKDVYQRASSLWASANADARVRVHRKMLITRWRASPRSDDFNRRND